MPTCKEQLEQRWAKTNRRIAELLAAGLEGWELQGELDAIEYEASLESLKCREL